MIKAIVCDFFRVILLPKNEVSSTQTDALSIVGNFVINHQLIDYLSQHSLVKVIFSNSGSLLEMPLIKHKLSDHFDQIFSAKKLQTSKSLPAGFILIADILKLKPEEMIFIDDDYTNILAAQKAGLKTIQFFNNSQVCEQLHHLIKS